MSAVGWQPGVILGIRGYFSEGRERLSAILSTERCGDEQSGTLNSLPGQQNSPIDKVIMLQPWNLPKRVWRFTVKSGDQQGIASVLIKLGNAATEAGDYETASGFLEEALDDLAETG